MVIDIFLLVLSIFLCIYERSIHPWESWANIVLVMNYERTIFDALGLLLRLEFAAAGLYSYTLESDLTLCAWHCVQLMSQVHQAPSQPEGGPHHRQDAGVDERGLPLSVLSFLANLTSSNRLCGGAMVEWPCCRSWAIYGLPRLLYGCRPRLLTTSSWVSYWFPLLTVAKPSTLADPLRPTPPQPPLDQEGLAGVGPGQTRKHRSCSFSFSASRVVVLRVSILTFFVYFLLRFNAYSH
jgi:hypothetical protein